MLLTLGLPNVIFSSLNDPFDPIKVVPLLWSPVVIHEPVLILIDSPLLDCRLIMAVMLISKVIVRVLSNDHPVSVHQRRGGRWVSDTHSITLF